MLNTVPFERDLTSLQQKDSKRQTIVLIQLNGIQEYVSEDGSDGLFWLSFSQSAVHQ
jgi:hypothetical protein